MIKLKKVFKFLSDFIDDIFIVFGILFIVGASLLVFGLGIAMFVLGAFLLLIGIVDPHALKKVR